tara:strand:- start:2569 stop:2787 length:219 start_codon:yes stop_codon:yes gene_type:complete
MVKKCIVCDAEARYKIKDTSDYYCQECAEENFSDVEMLVTVEDEANRLKQFIKERLAHEPNDKDREDQYVEN